MAILITGALYEKTTDIELTQQAFINGFGHFGNIFVTINFLKSLLYFYK